MFFAAPFGTHPAALLEESDADMDNATQRGLDWAYLVHGDKTNNVLFADSHVASFGAFQASEMTHDTAERGIDWGAIEPKAARAAPHGSSPAGTRAEVKKGDIQHS
jgi:prepilin-type processing-associated H-X9-DG protein